MPRGKRRPESSSGGPGKAAADVELDPGPGWPGTHVVPSRSAARARSAPSDFGSGAPAFRSAAGSVAL